MAYGTINFTVTEEDVIDLLGNVFGIMRCQQGPYIKQYIVINGLGKVF